MYRGEFLAAFAPPNVAHPLKSVAVFRHADLMKAHVQPSSSSFVLVLTSLPCLLVLVL
jgi:hypothetical protein